VYILSGQELQVDVEPWFQNYVARIYQVMFGSNITWIR